MQQDNLKIEVIEKLVEDVNFKLEDSNLKLSEAHQVELGNLKRKLKIGLASVGALAGGVFGVTGIGFGLVGGYVIARGIGKALNKKM